MNFLQNAIIFAVISIVAAQYYQPQRQNVQARSSPGRPVQVPQYLTLSQSPTLVAYTLQLPKQEAPNVPFYNPIANLQPPKVQTQNVPVYYEYPEPSVDLQAPTEGSWNPSNDPSLYYGGLPVVVDYEAPTNQHPKKFNKDIHEKKYSGEPKKEVILKPVSSDELAQLHKTADKFAKLENQKQIRNEKAQQAVQI